MYPMTKKFIPSTPFNQTHERKKDKMPAQMLAEGLSQVMYRVQIKGPRTNEDKILTATPKDFKNRFVPCA
jgi:hypothetical protein